MLVPLEWTTNTLPMVTLPNLQFSTYNLWASGYRHLNSKDNPAPAIPLQLHGLTSASAGTSKRDVCSNV